MAGLCRDEWDHVLSFLGPKDLVSVSMASKRLLAIARSHRPRVNTPVFATETGLKRVWPHLAFVESFEATAPVTCARADGAHLFMGCGDGDLVKMHMDTHTTCWRVTHRNARNWIITVGPEDLYTGCNNGHVKRVSKVSGEVLWCSRCENDINALLLKDGLLCVGCAGGTLRVMDADKGHIIWRHHDETGIMCISAVEELLHYSNYFGAVSALDMQTGLAIQVQTAPALHFALPSAMVLGTNWVVSGAEKCSPGCPAHPFCDLEDPECDLREVLYRQNIQTGQVTWEVDVEATVACVDEDGICLFFACRNCEIRQVDLGTGKQTWGMRLPKADYICDVHVCGDHLYATDSRALVHKIVL